jgi:hypothetical protein
MLSEDTGSCRNEHTCRYAFLGLLPAAQTFLSFASLRMLPTALRCLSAIDKSCSSRNTFLVFDICIL